MFGITEAEVPGGLSLQGVPLGWPLADSQVEAVRPCIPAAPIALYPGEGMLPVSLVGMPGVCEQNGHL
jgi:hypothetical protein